MFRRQLWLFLFLLASGQTARSEPPQETGKSARTDRFGDPLPVGAVARAGSLRLRHAGPVRAVTFTPNGEFLVSGGHDGIIYFWDPATGKEMRCFSELPFAGYDAGQVWSLAFSPNGKTLAVGRSGTTLLLEPRTGKIIRELKDWGVASVAYSPDGKLLATGTNAKTIGLWDAATGDR